MTSETTEKQDRLRRKQLQELYTHIFLVLLVVLYSVVGAKLFQAIEQGNEERVKINLIKSKHALLEHMSIGVGHGVDRTNWTKMADRLLGYYVEDLAEAAVHGVDIADVTQHEFESESKWDFWGSLFYAGTVYTTIGYGNIAPATPQGKLATIIYGMIGIPLCLILLADLGKLIAKLIRRTVKFAKKHIYSCSKHEMREKWPPQSEIDSMSGKSSLVVLLLISIVYTLCGAVMYKVWEDDWTYLDAVYFIFVTTSTIGFGDVLPDHPVKFMVSSLYIFVGLALISTGLTIIQELLESKITETEQKIKDSLGLDAPKKTGSVPAKDEPDASTSSNNNDVKSTATFEQHSTIEARVPPPAPEPVEPEPIVEEIVSPQTAAPQTAAAPKSAAAPTAEPKTAAQKFGASLTAPQKTETPQSVAPKFGARKTTTTEEPKPAPQQQPKSTTNQEDQTRQVKWRYLSKSKVEAPETRVVKEDNRDITVEATIFLDS